MNYAEHYDKQYKDPASIYAEAYHRALPPWAEAMNNWNVCFAAGVLNLEPGKDKILDIGSGMGYFIDAWERMGFECDGVDVSAEAIRRSGRTNIICHDATDLSEIPSGKYSVVFSAAFMEHIEDADCAKMVQEFHRIAPIQAHFIGHDKGIDEGHVNIKTPAEWCDWLRDQNLPNIVRVGNPLAPLAPLIVSVQHMPAALEHTLMVYPKENAKN